MPDGFVGFWKTEVMGVERRWKGGWVQVYVSQGFIKRRDVHSYWPMRDQYLVKLTNERADVHSFANGLRLGQSSPVNFIHSIKAFKPVELIILTNERPVSDHIDQSDQLRKELYHQCRVWCGGNNLESKDFLCQWIIFVDKWMNYFSLSIVSISSSQAGRIWFSVPG